MEWYVLLGFVVLALLSWLCGWERTNFLTIVGAVVSLIVAINSTDWAKDRDREIAEAAQREATPHVIREADGCKVYAFKTDRYHYFTKCGSSVSTETTWSQSCGKACTKEMSDVITTEGNK